MSHLRTLGDIQRACQLKNLNPTTSMQGDLIFNCPACNNTQRASAWLEHGLINARCYGCDGEETLAALGHDPDHNEPHEIILRVFDLLWAIQRPEP